METTKIYASAAAEHNASDNFTVISYEDSLDLEQRTSNDDVLYDPEDNW